MVDALPAGSCSLVLAGHLHGGQICLPRPGGRIRLSHTEWRYLDGVHRVGGTTLVVSRGTGTTLVPFRLLARPEVSLLRLSAARPSRDTPTARVSRMSPLVERASIRRSTSRLAAAVGRVQLGHHLAADRASRPSTG